MVANIARQRVRARARIASEASNSSWSAPGRQAPLLLFDARIRATGLVLSLPVLRGWALRVVMQTL